MQTMNDWLIEKNSKYKKIHLLGQWFDYRTVKHPVWLGSSQWSSPLIKNKWIKREFSVEGEWGVVSEIDLARAYLSTKYNQPGERRRVTTAQYHSVMTKRNTPLMAIPTEFFDGIYLDLKSAYWQIVQVVGWDVGYYPRKFLAKRSESNDFPYPHHKLARNALVSLGMTGGGGGTMWTGKKLVTIKSGNPFYNNVLWACVADVLHAFASDMIEDAQAQYVFTDGFILPLKHADTAFTIAEEWGLVLREKSRGESQVKGAGAYRVGKLESITYRRARPRPFTNIVGGNEWLRRRYKFFAERTNLILP